MNEANENNVAADSPTQETAFDDNSNSSGFSFDSVIFGPGDEGGSVEQNAPVDAPNPGVQTNPQGVAPQDGPPTIPEEPYQAKNDDKRFEYWQSRATKLENQLKEQQPLVDYVNQNPQAIQQPQATPEPELEEFPAPPTKPERPHDYNRELAYTDPSSSSARYDGAVESWRDDMDEYNSLKLQYETARVQERLDSVEEQRLAQQQQAQARQAQNEKASEVAQYVQANYDMTPEETQSFMKDMSNPSSISMENLVTLWRMNNGKSAAPPAATPGLQGEAPTQNVGPSANFQQTQRAQQVPQPMGVVPGQGSSNPGDGMSDGEKFIAALTNSYKDNQAF
jgi:hypothetical protein